VKGLFRSIAARLKPRAKAPVVQKTVVGLDKAFAALTEQRRRNFRKAHWLPDLRQKTIWGLHKHCGLTPREMQYRLQDRLRVRKSMAL
jgi:hypothetical protein